MPIAPVHPPRVGEPGIRTVATQPVIKSEMAPGSAFVFRKDSAGLGVPREGFGNLSSFSKQAGMHGVASTPIYMEDRGGQMMQPGRGPSPVAITGSGMRAGSPPASPQPVNVGSRPVSGGGGGMSSQPVSAPAQGAPGRAR
jgi:hypothetical protein